MRRRPRLHKYIVISVRRRPPMQMTVCAKMTVSVCEDQNATYYFETLNTTTVFSAANQKPNKAASIKIFSERVSKAEVNTNNICERNYPIPTPAAGLDPSSVVGKNLVAYTKRGTKPIPTQLIFPFKVPPYNINFPDRKIFLTPEKNFPEQTVRTSPAKKQFPAKQKLLENLPAKDLASVHPLQKNCYLSQEEHLHLLCQNSA